jgi:RNA polymerase sigma-70 factor (ECF subfamily)
VNATVAPILDQLPAETPQTPTPGLRDAPAGNAAVACDTAASVGLIYSRTAVSSSEEVVAQDPAEKTGPCMDALCDEELLRRYSDVDDQLAFRALYIRYRIRLHRFIRRLSCDSHEAEEVFQETWLGVIRGKETNSPVARFRAYVFAIAHRRLADRWRRRKRLSSLQPDIEIPCDPDEVADDLIVAPDEWTQHAQLQGALMNALANVPVPQREVFLMKAEADLSLEEIAKIMGITHEAAKSRLRYALVRLRAALRTWK